MVFDRRTWELVGGERAPGGYAVGLAGNQPERAEAVLRALDAPVDFVASSGRWGVEKPSRVFFERVCAEAGEPAPAIAYVGDRLDNDVLPARRAGMRAVFVRRGPWGFIHATWPEVAEADHRIDTLAELPELLRG
jgi:FMN phosphatase YigB (HAD superfamily)